MKKCPIISKTWIVLLIFSSLICEILLQLNFWAYSKQKLLESTLIWKWAAILVTWMLMPGSSRHGSKKWKNARFASSLCINCWKQNVSNGHILMLVWSFDQRTWNEVFVLIHLCAVFLSNALVDPFKFTLTEAIALFALMMAFSYYLSFNFLVLEILGEKNLFFCTKYRCITS